jgi:hypothetical protein
MIANYNLSQGQNKRFVSNQNYSHYDLSAFDNDFMMSCPDRICSECGNEHSFRGNFEGVATSIDILSILFSKDLNRNIKSEVFLS